jgi:plastocyanin domain-containing protein
MKYALIFAALLTMSASGFAAEKMEKQTVNLSVTEKGFEPSSIDVKPGVPVVLKVTRKTDATCATQVQIPSHKIKRDLLLNKEVSIEIGKLEKGEIRFACGMNMLEGKIIIK